MLNAPKTFADDNDVSREVSLHPVHLTPDKEGNLPPSALVPFCSYQGNGSLFGHELDNMSVCGKFTSTILKGQLCYTLEIAKLREKHSKYGKENGLFLLLDPNPFQIEVTEENPESPSKATGQSFKVFIQNLAQYTIIGPGSFALSTLKRTTGTESFKQLPDHQKECMVHNREECQTQKYLSEVQRECGCTPWSLQGYQDKEQVKAKSPVQHTISTL